jgi:integrase-like protein
MIYCISILENFSRAILASAISRSQDTEAYLAVLYAAIRKHGVPEVLVSDSGGVFRSQDAMRIYKALGIQKQEIEKRQAWQSYIESNFNAQRRLADWHFECAQTWEDLLAAHEKWLLDFNYQHHFAHEQREDGCHSPAAVLSWVKGMQPEPELLYRAFSAVGETRTITKAGYVRIRSYLLYGERNLAGLGHLLRERRGLGRLCARLGECGFSGGAVGGAQTGDAIWRGVSALQAQCTTVVGQEKPLMDAASNLLISAQASKVC